MNFLIVDDNRLLNRFLGIELKSKGHSVESLTDPTEVEEWLGANPCDGLILDIGMPKMNGFDLLRQLRLTYDRNRLVVVIFTGAGKDAASMALAAECGANGYVTKELGPDELYDAIISAFERRDTAMAAECQQQT